MQIVRNPRVRTVYLVLSLSILLAGDAWRFTFGWWAVGVLAAILTGYSVALLIVQRKRWRFNNLPYPLIGFVALAAASLAWSFYPGATALGLYTTWMIILVALGIAVTYTWKEILRGLSVVLRIVLGLSLLFELFVSIVLRHPLLPFNTQPGVDYSDYKKIPKMLYWCRDELFTVLDEGRIQGIVGNANHLGFLALLGVMVFALQLAGRPARRAWTILWLVIAAGTLILTRSATVTVALVGMIIVAVAVLLVRRATSPRARAFTYAGLISVVLAGAALAVVLRGPLLAALGKSADFTGRFGIWAKVIDLAQQRPALGWGWVSYWVPWVAPFDNLAFRNGVRQLQAHNAWLDIWLQLGIVGLVVFAALVFSTLARSWSFAVDRPQLSRSAGKPTVESLLPLLILAALLIQSIAESRLLVEFGMFFLILIAVKTKLGERADLPTD